MSFATPCSARRRPAGRGWRRLAALAVVTALALTAAVAVTQASPASAAPACSPPTATVYVTNSVGSLSVISEATGTSTSFLSRLVRAAVAGALQRVGQPDLHAVGGGLLRALGDLLDRPFLDLRLRDVGVRHLRPVWRRSRNLHHRRQPVRQRRLRAGAGGHPELRGHPGAPDDHRLLGDDGLRRSGAGHHRQLLGFRRKRHRRRPHNSAGLFNRGHLDQPGGNIRVVLFSSPADGHRLC